MKLLIIGKTGQLGSQLIIDAGKSSDEFTVIAPDKKELDISDHWKFLKIIRNEKPDVVINTAAYHILKQCEQNPLSAFRYNCISVKNMAEMCNNHHIKFITFSTNYVFNGLHNFYNEYEETEPLQMYGLSKLSGEHAALWYDTSTVIRTSVLYGTSGRNNFVDARIDDSKKYNSIEVDCKQLLSSTYTADLSKAVLELIKKDCWGIYHLVNEGWHSYYELTKEIYSIMDIDNPVFPVDQKCYYNGVKRPEYTVLENTRSKDLGITLPDWKNALKRYLTLKYGV
jgi:dTDP-4-dehydrorhamnose reductase